MTLYWWMSHFLSQNWNGRISNNFPHPTLKKKKNHLHCCWMICSTWFTSKQKIKSACQKIRHWRDAIENKYRSISFYGGALTFRVSLGKCIWLCFGYFIEFLMLIWERTFVFHKSKQAFIKVTLTKLSKKIKNMQRRTESENSGHPNSCYC